MSPKNAALIGLYRGRAARSTPLFFDMRLQPGQRIVPLLGYLIEIIPDLLDRLWFELEQALAADAYIAHHPSIGQDAKVFGHRLPRQMGADGQTGNGLRHPSAKLREHRESRLVAESGKHRCSRFQRIN